MEIEYTGPKTEYGWYLSYYCKQCKKSHEYYKFVKIEGEYEEVEDKIYPKHLKHIKRFLSTEIRRVCKMITGEI